jgi:hypothetical protein
MPPTWNSVFRVSSDDTMFSVAFSSNQGSGGQGTGTPIATYPRLCLFFLRPNSPCKEQGKNGTCHVTMLIMTHFGDESSY